MTMTNVISSISPTHKWRKVETDASKDRRRRNEKQKWEGKLNMNIEKMLFGLLHNIMRRGWNLWGCNWNL